jgi:hypothetical protein
LRERVVGCQQHEHEQDRPRNAFTKTNHGGTENTA